MELTVGDPPMVRTPLMQNPANQGGVCKSTGVERGITMILSVLVLILLLLRKRRTKLKLDIEL
jgi:hypothetical protein